MGTKTNELLQRITANLKIFGSKPIIRSMRISVEIILGLLAQNVTIEEILEDYPGLEREDVLACIAYAHAVLGNESLEEIKITQ